MLLVLDVGNTNTVLGVFARAAQSADEPPRYEQLVALLNELFPRT